MTFEDLEQWTSQLGSGEKWTAATKKRIEAELPGFIRDLNAKSAPPKLRLPTGETLGNATRMTALKCQCLLLARSVAGAEYVKRDEQNDRLAKDVLFWVMRHAFNSGDPHGVFCCAPCTLSLLPLYAAGCFRWVDCDELAANVIAALREETSVFQRGYPKAYAQWALGLAAKATKSRARRGGSQ